jgi:hypothetical protein
MNMIRRYKQKNQTGVTTGEATGLLVGLLDGNKKPLFY